MTDKDLVNAIDGSSKITVRVLLTLMGLTVPLLIAVVTFLWTLKQDMRDVRHDVEAMKTEQYTIPRAVADAMLEAIANPKHNVPDPSRPGEFIPKGPKLPATVNP